MDWYALLGSATVASTVIVFLSRAPVRWDARSIWFFHASWFADKTTPYAVAVASTTAYGFSHLDYPPLTASIGAFAWRLGNPRNDWIPQFATGILTLACCAVLAILISRYVNSAWERLAVGLISTLLFLAIIRGNGLDGYVDGLAALLVTVLVVMAFSAKDDQVVIIFAIAAALVKNESFVFLVAVIVPLYLLRRRSIRPLVPGLVMGTAWIIAIRTTGIALESWRPANAFPWSPAFGDRMITILGEIVSSPSLWLAAAIWIGALILHRTANASKATLEVLIGTGIVAGTIVAIELGMYLATPFLDVRAHLETSVDRLLILPSMALLTGGLIGVAGAWMAFSREMSRHDHPPTVDSP
jgi:hypothetical protein